MRDRYTCIPKNEYVVGVHECFAYEQCAHETSKPAQESSMKDIGEACLFLAENAGFATGQTITPNGGMTVKMV